MENNVCITYGHFKYNVMFFGLTNALANFQHMMNDLFKNFLDDLMIIYLDDLDIIKEPKGA
jgi:hypothetical protein